MSYDAAYPRHVRIAAARRRLLATTLSGYLAAIVGGLIAIPLGLTLVLAVNYLV